MEVGRLGVWGAKSWDVSGERGRIVPRSHRCIFYDQMMQESHRGVFHTNYGIVWRKVVVKV